MNFMNNVICPISFEKIDSNVSRLTVFMNAMLIAAYVILGHPVFILMVAIDYSIRAVWKPQYSPIRAIAVQMSDALGWKPKMIDKAPKVFASRVGFLFAATSALLMVFGFVTSAVAVAAILLIFTIMDSVLDFCVGCITYSFIVLPVYKAFGIR